MTAAERDYSETLFLPKTEFPMRAGLPQKEPDLLARWSKLDIYRRHREQAKGRPRFILHDGPPFANGHIHVGHALGKILKDFVVRSHQMLGFDSNYVPGWDCHGLPVEWKVEEDYRAKGRVKESVPVAEFRAECRAFAQQWIEVQRDEFARLGGVGDWDHYYTTMSFQAEAQIARELMKFAANGLLYRGSKPVMWSVVEKTALAEAEVEYEDYVSDQVWVKFPLKSMAIEPDDAPLYRGATVVIWTTTPWTIPGNRAISFSPKIAYGLYEVTDAPADNWTKAGDKFLLAENLAIEVLRQARVTAFKQLASVPAEVIASLVCAHPLKGVGGGYEFDVPLLAGDHVSDDAGAGFVHTAPGHGREDFEVWTANTVRLARSGIDTFIPYTVDENGAFTDQAPGFAGKRVLSDKGEKGDANDAVIKALADAGMLIARGRLKHQYPHSWRSKKPLIFRNTPQWFVAMDRDIAGPGDTLRARALNAIKLTRWVPPQGENRITGMVVNKPDWVLSRQRVWGVPLTLFVRDNADGTVEVLRDARVNERIGDVFEREGVDAWFATDARDRFLNGLVDNPALWRKIDDTVDVWFDSGCTHAFTLEMRDDLKVKRAHAGGPDTVMYLEGSDQHRGWFQSSLMESCGTRGEAPYDVVLTHGFILDEKGVDKMSKSRGNVASPMEICRTSGADILRLWAAASDYADDVRFGPEIFKNFVETYRKLRNTIRWMLGNLAHVHEDERMAVSAMPELERLMLHRLAELDAEIRQDYLDFDYKRIVAQLNAFLTSDLSAFYFDIRKDALYCDPISSLRRRASLTVIDHLFRTTVTWLAPILPFTAEEAWLSRHPSEDSSVHLQQFPEILAEWRDDALAEKWRKVRIVRRVVTGALEIERAAKRIGSPLEANPIVHVSDPDLFAALVDIDLAEVCITSAATLVSDEGPADAFRLPDVSGVAVVVNLAEGTKCARSWKISSAVGTDAEFPEVTPRDAQALREWHTMRSRAAE
jgi:isoleucyl-tRNA synthetase